MPVVYRFKNDIAGFPQFGKLVLPFSPKESADSHFLCFCPADSNSNDRIFCLEELGIVERTVNCIIFRVVTFLSFVLTDGLLALHYYNSVYIILERDDILRLCFPRASLRIITKGAFFRLPARKLE